MGKTTEGSVNSLIIGMRVGETIIFPTSKSQAVSTAICRAKDIHAPYGLFSRVKDRKKATLTVKRIQ